jgi:hypothetical protein
MLALETLHAADMQYMQDINAEMNAALQQETAQRKAADEEFAAAIAAINTEVDKLNNETTELSFVVEYLAAYAEQLQAYVDENAVAIEANAASIELLKAADVVLKGMINDLRVDFEAYQKEVDAIYAKKSDVTAVKNWVVEELTKVQNTCLTEIKLVRENLNKVEKSLVDQIKANEGLILALDKAYKQADKEINEKIDKVKEELLTADEAVLDSLNNVAAKLNETIAHVADTLTQNIKNAVDAEKVAREEAVAALEATDKAQGIEIAALKSDLKSLEWTVSYLTGWAMETQASIDDILKRIAALEGNVNDLLARVQKIVYLPDYADHKATINAAMIGDVIIPAPATINYKVYPAELAAEIAEAYSDENPILYFDLKDVKTRTGNTSLEIVSVTGSEGVLSFVVSPRGFADEFFTKRANTSYSVALRLDNGNDDYSTEYTNLVPANEFAQISVAVYNGDLTAANQFVVLDADGETMLTDGAEIEYTDRKTTCQILPARQLGFQISGDDNIYSEEAIKAMGYDFVVESEVVYGAKNYEGAVETEEGINEIKKAFNTVADETTGTITVSLNDNAKAETVGNALETMYAYEVCGLQAKAGAVVAIVPVEYEFDITLPTITWTYTKDAGPESHGKDYRRSFVLDADDVVATDIPEDYDYIRVIKENGAVEAKVTVNGEPATVKKAVFKTVEIDGVHVPAVEFNGFEWNKTYELEGVCMLPSAKVTFRTTVQTVDRTRSDIRVDLRPIEFQYEKDLVIDYNDADAEVYSLSAVYDILKRGGNFGYMDEEIEAKIKAGFVVEIT